MVVRGVSDTAVCVNSALGDTGSRGFTGCLLTNTAFSRAILFVIFGEQSQQYRRSNCTLQALRGSVCAGKGVILAAELQIPLQRVNDALDCQN